MQSYGGLLGPRGSKLALLKPTFNAENFVPRLSWSISSHLQSAKKNVVEESAKHMSGLWLGRHGRSEHEDISLVSVEQFYKEATEDVSKPVCYICHSVCFQWWRKVVHI